MIKETVKLFWQATWKYKWLLIFSELGVLGLIFSVDIASPYIISQIVDRLTQGNVNELRFDDFKFLLIIFAILQVSQIGFGRLIMQPYLRLETNAVRDLENLSFKKLLGHSMAFFSDNFSGALTAKVNRLTASYQRFVETVLADLINFLIRYLAALIIIWFLQPLIAAIFLAWTLLFCTSLAYLHRRKLRHSKAAAAAQTRTTARLADIIANTFTIRSFARTHDEEKHFGALTQERRDLKLRAYLYTDYIRLYKNVAIAFLDIGVLGLSVYFAVTGSLSIGSIILIQFYLLRLTMELWEFGRFLDRIEESLADASEMTEIIMLPHGVVDPSKPEQSRINNGMIEFKNVVFQYPEAKSHRTLFNELTLRVESGQKIGLVGPSGGGKTTLTKLLLRFMDVNSGEILIDGQNIANLTQDDLRRAIAYVPQEPLLFHRSILENISYGNPDAEPEEVLHAAVRARADEFIQLLPKKYDTVVGERGVKLSGGQRQRVAIARAMLKKAPILVLDEATSSLDSVSEKLITEALDQLLEKRTTFVIAHRLSTIRKLDRILVLDDGQIKEDGSHEELLQKDGLYAKLWKHQSGDFIGEN